MDDSVVSLFGDESGSERLIPVSEADVLASAAADHARVETLELLQSFQLSMSAELAKIDEILSRGLGEGETYDDV